MCIFFPYLRLSFLIRGRTKMAIAFTFLISSFIIVTSDQFTNKAEWTASSTTDTKRSQAQGLTQHEHFTNKAKTNQSPCTSLDNRSPQYVLLL
jgi:hypothetical protein